METAPDCAPIQVDTYSALLRFVDCAFEKTQRLLMEGADPITERSLRLVFEMDDFQERFKLLVVFRTMLARHEMESNPNANMVVKSIDLKLLFKQVLEGLS